MGEFAQMVEEDYGILRGTTVRILQENSDLKKFIKFLEI